MLSVSSSSFAELFPVSYSALSPTALLTFVCSRYELSEPAQCVLFTHGVNDTYLITTPSQRYILRVYLTGWRSLTDILYEVDVLRQLDLIGASVSTAVAQRDGSFVSTLQAPEGSRHVVLFTYAPGVTPDRHSLPDSHAHGRALAALHHAADRVVSTQQRAPLDCALLLDQSLAAIEGTQLCSTDDVDYLHAIAERLRTQIHGFAAQGLDWGVCHGDSHILNTHRRDDGLVTFFDFECCAPGWRAYDLAVLRWCEGFYQMDPEDAHWNAFFSGYTEVRPLSEVDRASIAVFTAIREVWHAALVARLQVGSGTKGFAWMLQRTIRLLRAWEETELAYPSI